MRIPVWLIFILALLPQSPSKVIAASALPEGFVYLDTLDKSGKIKIALRYGTQNNFVGRPVAGYTEKFQRVILTEAAAKALLKAQERFEKDGFCLVIYDAYRPQSAVNDFMQWSRSSSDQLMKIWFYPRVDKSRVFELGYVAEKSGHSRGSTVDISLIAKGESPHAIIPSYRKLKDGAEVVFLDDGTVDMGTSFDLFDKASHYENDLIEQEHQERRRYLKEVMESCGFKNYAEEWWHFTLKEEPFPETYFDFPVN